MKHISDLIPLIGSYVGNNISLLLISKEWNRILNSNNTLIRTQLRKKYPMPTIFESSREAVRNNDLQVIKVLLTEYQGFLPMKVSSLLPWANTTSMFLFLSNRLKKVIKYDNTLNYNIVTFQLDKLPKQSLSGVGRRILLLLNSLLGKQADNYTNTLLYNRIPYVLSWLHKNGITIPEMYKAIQNNDINRVYILLEENGTSLSVYRIAGVLDSIRVFRNFLSSGLNSGTSPVLLGPKIQQMLKTESNWMYVIDHSRIESYDIIDKVLQSHIPEKYETALSIIGRRRCIELIDKYLTKDNMLKLTVYSSWNRRYKDSLIHLDIYRLMQYKGLNPDWIAFYAERSSLWGSTRRILPPQDHSFWRELLSNVITYSNRDEYILLRNIILDNMNQMDTPTVKWILDLYYKSSKDGNINMLDFIDRLKEIGIRSYILHEAKYLKL